jgi:hypothetical protein
MSASLGEYTPETVGLDVLGLDVTGADVPLSAEVGPADGAAVTGAWVVATRSLWCVHRVVIMFAKYCHESVKMFWCYEVSKMSLLVCPPPF